jgi:hypothetical protein
MQHGQGPSSILTLDGALEQHIGQFGYGQVRRAIELCAEGQLVKVNSWSKSMHLS